MKPLDLNTAAGIAQLIEAQLHLAKKKLLIDGDEFNWKAIVEDYGKSYFKNLSDEQRMETLSDYCKYCGKDETVHGKCYCAPHYDK